MARRSSRPLTVGGNGRHPRHWAKYANAANVRFKRTRQCKSLESHDLDTTARVHCADRRRGGSYMQIAAQTGIAPVVTLLALCGLTRREAYFDIVMVAIVGAVI